MYHRLAEKFPAFADERLARKQRKWWILNVLCPEEDDDGRVIGIPEQKKKPRLSDKDIYAQRWIAKGMPPERIEEKWAEVQEKIRKGKEEAEALRKSQSQAQGNTGVDFESGDVSLREPDPEQEKVKHKINRQRDSRR